MIFQIIFGISDQFKKWLESLFGMECLLALEKKLNVNFVHAYNKENVPNPS